MMRQGNRQRRTPLSDADFERQLYAAGELTDQDLARAGSMRRIRQPLSDAAFERQMRAEEEGRAERRRSALDGGTLYAAAANVRTDVQPAAQAAAPGNGGQAWQYNQRTGQLRRPDGSLVNERGYAGAPGYVNDPTAEGRRNQGPIPRGRWRIGELRNSARTGRDVMDLQPVGHNALGRTNIQMHGDNSAGNQSASTGCMVFPHHVRLEVGRGRVRDLDVVDEPEWR